MAFEPDVEHQLQKFSRICYPCWCKRKRTHTLRPERPEYSIVMGNEDDNATAKRQTVIRLLYNSLVVMTGFRSLAHFVQTRRIITGLTTILFDQECSRSANHPRNSMPTMDSGPWSSFIAPPVTFLSLGGLSGSQMAASLIEHMLLIDYGFGEHPLRPLGPEQTRMTKHMTRVVCHQFCKSLTKMVDDCRSGKVISPFRLAWLDQSIQSYGDKSSASDDYSDVALMFYFFWTRRHHISKDEYNRGMTGYEGVLDEMISEVPTTGTDRLTRKLSVDVNELIPRYVKDEECRTEMIAAAKRIAAEYGVALRAPESAFEYLNIPTALHNVTPSRQVITRQISARHNDTATFERLPTPPPTYNETPPPGYNEAMGLLRGEIS